MAGPQSAWQHGTEPFGGREAEGPEGMQMLFLLRLRRLIWLRRSCVGQLDDAIIKVLDKSIYSTFCDCTELGVGDSARELLKQTV